MPKVEYCGSRAVAMALSFFPIRCLVQPAIVARTSDWRLFLSFIVLSVNDLHYTERDGSFLMGAINHGYCYR